MLCEDGFLSQRYPEQPLFKRPAEHTRITYLCNYSVSIKRSILSTQRKARKNRNPGFYINRSAKAPTHPPD
eukprot:scaffold4619_cov146-Skeletonema_menzelii.AAC.7